MLQDKKTVLQKLNLHANQTLLAVIDWNLERKITFWNKSAEKIFGYTKEEVLNKDGFKLVLPSYLLEQFDAVWENFLKNKVSIEGTNENITKQGDIITCKWYNTPIIDKNGKVISITSLVMDVTEETELKKETVKINESYKELINKLKISEIKYKAITDYSFNWEYWLDEEGNYIYISPTCEKVSGYTPNEFKENPNLLFEITKSDYKEQVINHYTSKDYTLTHALEFVINHKNGSEVWIEHKCAPIHDENGNFLGRRGVNRDITQNKTSATEIYQLNKALDSSKDVIFITNKKGIITYINKAFTKLYGYKEKEVVNIKSPKFLSGHSVFCKEELNQFYSSLKANKSVVKEFTNTTNKGATVIVEASHDGLFDRGGNYNGYLSIQRDITNKKKEQQLILNLQKAVTASKDVIFMTDVNGVFTFVNPEFTKLYGYSKEEVIGKETPRILKSGDKTKKEYTKVWNALLAKNSLTIIYLNKTKDGRLIDIEASADAILNDKGEVVGFMAIQRDVTKRNLLEKTIKESEEKYRMMIESTNDFVWTISSNAEITFFNQKIRSIPGFNFDEWKGKQFFPLILEEEKEVVIDAFKQTINGKPKSLVVGFKVLGKTMHLKVNTAPIYSNNQIVGLVCLGRDITKEIRQEKLEKIIYEISHLATKDINLQEFILVIKKELSKVIDTTNFFIAYHDKESNMLYSPFVFDELDEIDSWPYDSKSMSSYIIENKKPLLIREKEILELIEAGVFEQIGSIPKVFLGAPLIENNVAIGVLAFQSYTNKNAYSKGDLEILEFVSNQIGVLLARKKSEDELKIALEKAKESDRMKSVFLATMSHELRTPLNAIIGFSEIMSEGVDVDKCIQFSEIIHKSGTQLFQLVNDIFDVTLLDSGNKKITKEKIELKPVLDHVKTLIDTENNKLAKDIKITLDFDEQFEGIKIETDKFKFQQVLINLLKNALKFTEKGSVTFGFTEDVFNDNHFLKFYIKDTGIGISKENQNKIFDRFTQVEDKYTRQYEGAGIGLSLSKKIIDLLGGEIWVDSALGKGSIFYFTVPYDKKVTVKKQENLKSNVNSEGLFKGKTILIAEDESTNYQYLKILLRKTEATVIWVKNGLEAVEKCKEPNQKIDIILMDLKMPILSGIDATLEIKQIRPDLPIIAQTAFANFEDKDEAIKAGCDDYLTKPLERKKLIKIISNYI